MVLNDAEYRPSAEVRGRGNVKFGAKCRAVTSVPAAATRPPCSTTIHSILAFVLLPGCRDGTGTLAKDFIVEFVVIFMYPQSEQEDCRALVTYD